MNGQEPILLVFVDGLGLGEAGPDNPLCPEIAPALCGLLREHSIAIDAGLGVPGLPQSATGQTTMLTGVNAALVCGRHVEGFPGVGLRKLVQQHNILLKLARAGLRCTFANAYGAQNLAEVLALRRHSVTTVATLSALGTVRYFDQLCHDKAVYQDLTRDLLIERGLQLPRITPEQAAAHLIGVAAEHDFTLFEFFLTDRAGHRRASEYARQVLTRLDRFLATLVSELPRRGITLVLTSDHGNIEDLSIPTHTYNRVPWMVKGSAAPTLLQDVHSLQDVSPALLRHFTPRKGKL